VFDGRIGQFDVHPQPSWHTHPSTFVYARVHYHAPV
jgi:hypothetical protein